MTNFAAPRPCYALAIDTANEVIALGIGALDAENAQVKCVYSETIEAHRASNTQLVPRIDQALQQVGITRDQIACVVCGRGPGSFTGVRIAMATAKGIAHALGVGLIGVSTLESIAWGAWSAGKRGTCAVVADAMRKEVYPVRFALTEMGVERLEAVAVVKADVAASALAEAGNVDCVAGDGLRKYAELFEACAPALDQELWTASGAGILLALQAAWTADLADPFDAERHNPSFTLPVYTRLSDAEENERMNLPKRNPKNLVSGVQGERVTYKPLDARSLDAVVAFDEENPGEDVLRLATTCKTKLVWLAYEEGAVVGYACGSVEDAQLMLDRVLVRLDEGKDLVRGELMARMASDARDLGATSYDGQPIEGLLNNRDVAGMELQVGGEMVAPQIDDSARPLILALESSCDETAAAIVNGKGEIVASVVASQIDFHARFGGVVPEIASRKHIEAICGVCDVCFEQAAAQLGVPALSWENLDSVAVTYTPGLVGALVVGVAFAKGAAWAAGKSFIGVNHLEGHLYANKIGTPDLQPPLVASLVSGGNTMLVHVKDWGNYVTLGTTLDDAVGEAFDKVAKALGLGYPGGPAISRFAAEGNPKAIAFPRAMLHSGDLQFSLSGLKTAVITYIHGEEDAGRELNIPDIAASFQAAVVDVQVAKAKTALEMTGAKEFCLGGGVAANPALRAAYTKLCNKMGVRLTLPPMSVCGDNAAMIALVALDRYNQGKFFDLSTDASAHTNLDEPY